MSEQHQWRQFEKLVARIEKMAAPLGAAVKSPDRIPDLVTGELREVDASIRYQIGTTPILITIECRKRNRKQDDTWIEQLATKRAKIGAAKTIAVSSTGFSGSAHKTARLHNIELRQLSELQTINPDEWFLKGGAVHICREFSEIKCAVTLKCSDGRPADWSAAMKDEFQPVFHHKLINSPFPAATLLSIAEQVQPEAFRDVPLDGTPKVVTLTLDFASCTGDARLLVKWIDRNRHDCLAEVSYVRLTVTAAYRTAVCNLDSGIHHTYKGPEGTDIKHSHFDTEWLGLPVRFDRQQDAAGNITASWELRRDAQPPRPPTQPAPPPHRSHFHPGRGVVHSIDHPHKFPRHTAPAQRHRIDLQPAGFVFLPHPRNRQPPLVPIGKRPPQTQSHPEAGPGSLSRIRLGQPDEDTDPTRPTAPN